MEVQAQGSPTAPVSDLEAQIENANAESGFASTSLTPPIGNGISHRVGDRMICSMIFFYPIRCFAAVPVRVPVPGPVLVPVGRCSCMLLRDR